MLLGYSLAKAHVPIRPHIWSLVPSLPFWKICETGARWEGNLKTKRDRGVPSTVEFAFHFLPVFASLFGSCIYTFV